MLIITKVLIRSYQNIEKILIKQGREIYSLSSEINAKFQSEQNLTKPKFKIDLQKKEIKRNMR